MTALGQPEVARICLTHSFPLPDIRAFNGRMDCTGEQLAFLQDFLSRNPYDDYDRLIQLCDAISLPDGACIVEKRLVDVALRHGVTELSIESGRPSCSSKSGLTASAAAASIPCCRVCWKTRQWIWCDD